MLAPIKSFLHVSHANLEDFTHECASAQNLPPPWLVASRDNPRTPVFRPWSGVWLGRVAEIQETKNVCSPA
jgi:hypothetical protein